MIMLVTFLVMLFGNGCMLHVGLANPIKGQPSALGLFMMKIASKWRFRKSTC